MKISPQRPTPVTQVTAQDKPQAPVSRPAVRSGESQTRFSPEFGMLQQAREKLNAQPEVDMEKVARLRQAIANDELPVDLDALSQAILELHRR